MPTCSLIAEISAASRQDGTIEVVNYVASLEDGENEPDYYDAIETVLEADGADFWDAVTEFAVWRALTGDFTVSGYLGHAEDLPPVSFEAELDWAALPVSGFQPTNQPSETGTNYLYVSLDDATFGSMGDAVVLRITSENSHWHLAGITWDLEGEVRIEETRTDTGSAALAVDELVVGEDLLLAVTNLGDLTHDPDEQDWPPSDYTAEITLVSQPVVDSITPASVERGQEGVDLTIVGSHLGETLMVDFGDGVTVTNLTFNGEGTQIEATVGIAADTESGFRDVTLAYDVGPSATVVGGLEITAGLDETNMDQPPANDSSTGCSCSLVSSRGGPQKTRAGSWILIGLCGLCWTVIRSGRRRCSP